LHKFPILMFVCCPQFNNWGRKLMHYKHKGYREGT
jgi:hypothetical protein